MSNQNDNSNQEQNQDKKNYISNENPLYETVPGGYRESYIIIRCQPNLSAAEKILYDELVFYYTESGKHHNETAYPSQRTLARKLGISRSAVNQTLGKLANHELIEVRDRKNAQGKEYVLLNYPIWIWNEFFLMLEYELEHSQNKKKKQRAIEIAKSKMLLQWDVRTLTSTLENLRGTLEFLSGTLEFLSANQKLTDRKLGSDGSLSEAADSPINQSNLSEDNYQSNLDTNVSSNEVRRKDSEESANAVSHSDGSEFSNPKRSFSELLELFEKNHSDWNKSNGHLKALLDIFGISFDFARIGQIRKKYSNELITEALKRLRSANKSSTEIGSVEKYLFGILERMQKESESQPLSSGKEDYQWPDNLPEVLPQNPACWTAEQQSLYQPPPYDTENYNRFWDLVEGKEVAS